MQGGKTNEDEFEVTSKMKPSQSSSKVFANARTSKMPSSPAKFKAPLRPNNGNNLTPMTKKSAMDISERKRSTPKSSHKSINFTHAKEFSKFTSTIIRKIDGSRIDSNSKASKECPTPLRTPNQVLFFYPIYSTVFSSSSSCHGWWTVFHLWTAGVYKWKTEKILGHPLVWKPKVYSDIGSYWNLEMFGTFIITNSLSYVCITVLEHQLIPQPVSAKQLVENGTFFLQSEKLLFSFITTNCS